MEDNSTTNGQEQAKSRTDSLGETAEDLKGKANDAFNKAEDKAEKLWDAAKVKADELAEKIKSGELADDAKEKLQELAEGAKALWSKVVDQFDGDKTPDKKPE